MTRCASRSNIQNTEGGSRVSSDSVARRWRCMDKLRSPSSMDLFFCPPVCFGRCSLPLLKSRNSGVVLAVCTTHYYCGSRTGSTMNQVAKAMVRILRNRREIQFVVLDAIRSVGCSVGSRTPSVKQITWTPVEAAFQDSGRNMSIRPRLRQRDTILRIQQKWFWRKMTFAG